jgi:hypothetical protein
MKLQHVQCRLRRDTTEMVAWIPKKVAILDRVVDLDDPENGPTTGWTVATVGSYAVDSKWANERSRDHLNQRRRTDI